MNTLRAVFRFFVYSNFYIAIIAILMALQTGWLFDGMTDPLLLQFIGFATLCSYSFHYYLTDHSVLPSPRIKWTGRYQSWILALFFFSLAGAAWYGWQLINYWPWLIPAIIATFLYSAPKIPHPFFRALRKVAIGKTIFLAFIWMYVTAVLPLVISGRDWTLSMRAYCFSQFFFLYAICILFDIRDREDDKADGVKSLITFLSPANIRRLYYFSLGTAMAGIGIVFWGGGPLLSQAFLLIPIGMLFFMYDKAVSDLSDSFYYFLLDGMMALSSLLLAISRI